MNTPNDKLITDAVYKYSDTVFRVAFQYTKDRAEAEDILQGVYLQLIKTPPSLAVDDDRFKAWLIRVTINKSKDFLRACKRARTAKRDYIPAAPTDSHEEVFEALARLSERDRNVLYLHYYEGYTAREISDMIGGSERAVIKRIERARKKLKDFLEE